MDPNTQLMRLTLEHRPKLFAYVYARVPNRADAEDLVQETFLTACEKFSDFDEGTNFAAWIRQIATFKIKHFQRTFARSRVLFDDSVLEKLEATSIAMENELDASREALDCCMKKLKPRDREMVEVRYSKNGGVSAAATACGRSVQATYKALHRIRESLSVCVQRQLEMV